MSSKLREALEDIVDMGTCYFPDFTLPKDDDELQDAIIEKASDYTSLRDDFIKAVIIARTALAEPLRNCDVGTAEEQIGRWHKFCKTQTNCEECPCHKKEEDLTAMCFAHWSQMPYESSEQTKTTTTKTNKGE